MEEIKKSIEEEENNKIEQFDFIEDGKIKTQLKVIPYFISEYSIYLLTVLIVLIFLIIPQYHSGKTVKSKINHLPFNKNYIPKILAHFTDIHVSHIFEHKTNGSYNYIKEFIKYKPDLILATGDFIDNFEGDIYWKRLGTQELESWKLYNKTIREILSKYPVIDVSGNHELFALDSLFSPENYFLDYSFIFNRTNVKTYEDFVIRKIKIFNLTFILFNDFRFPNPHPPYGKEPHTTKHQLNLLENMIDNLEEEECYILTHYHVDRCWLIKSDKGHYIEEILSDKKVAFIFSGHDHPHKLKIIHHGSEGGLEYCTSSPYNHHRSGLITIDNGNLIYHDVYIEPSSGKRPLFFMTYPVPSDQVSSHHIFNLNNFEIRVLSYITDKNIILKVDGDVKGELKYVMTLNNKAILYSLSVNLKNGIYKIHVYDKDKKFCNIKREFIVGDTYQGKREKAIDNPRFLFLKRFSAIHMILFLFFIIIPFKFGNDLEIVTKLENFIEGGYYSYNNNILIYFYLIIFSPFIIRNRFFKVNKICRYCIIFFSIYPLFFPLHIFNSIDGKIGFQFNVFIVLGTHIQYEHWALDITYYYYLCIIFPNLFHLTSFEQYSKKEKNVENIYYFNMLLNLIGCFYILLINFGTMIEATSLIYLIVSPYIVIYTIIKIIIYKYCYEEKQKEKQLIKEK